MGRALIDAFSQLFLLFLAAYLDSFQRSSVWLTLKKFGGTTGFFIESKTMDALIALKTRRIDYPRKNLKQQN